jgi:hypothetical protein
MGVKVGLDVMAKRKKSPSPYRESNSGLAARTLVTILTELSRLQTKNLHP